MRQTVTIDKHVSDNVIPIIDETNYMLLHESERSDLMIYAMALGWDTNLSIELSKPKSGGFVRTSYLSSSMITLIRIAYLSSVGDSNIDMISEIDPALSLFEKYANAGFHLLESELDEHKDTEVKANNIIAELNNRYNMIFDENDSENI